MRRALAICAVVAGALAAPAAAGLFTGIAFAPDCGFRRLCVDVGVKQGLLALVGHNDKFELRLSVVYEQKDKAPVFQTVTVPTKQVSEDPGTLRATVIVPREISGVVTISVKAVLARAGINRTGDRAFFVDETGVIRAEPGLPPCDDTDEDPTNDCPGALNN